MISLDAFWIHIMCVLVRYLLTYYNMITGIDISTVRYGTVQYDFHMNHNKGESGIKRTGDGVEIVSNIRTILVRNCS